MRYKETFQIFQTLEQAQEFIKGRKATLTPWSSSDGTKSGFIVWYFA